MPLKKVDNISALIVIDLQKNITSLPTVHPVSDIVGRAAHLARAFRDRGLPVVLVNVTAAAPGRNEVGRPNLSFAPDWAELVPELDQHEGDYFVSKKRVGAFIGTSLQDYLQQRGVEQIFLEGISTSGGVESTGRSAYDHGHNVVFVVDAMTDRDPDAHRYSTEKMFPRLGETETTDNGLKMLAAR